MRANLRFNMVLLSAGLALLPAIARAQDTAQPATTNSPASETVGPRELQNFSLPGAATKPADPTAKPPENTGSAAQNETQSAQTVSPAPSPVRRSVESRTAAKTAAPPRAITAPSTSASSAFPAPATEAAAPPPRQPSLPAPASAQPSTPAPAFTPEPERKLAILPWILAALVFAGGTLFLLWRRRPREALAGGGEFDLLVPREAPPAPSPSPRSPPPRATPPQSTLPQPVALPSPKPSAPAANGIVASRLRPSLEIGLTPLRCLVEDNQVTIEFEVELFNAGAAPARAVLAEASLLNASATQDQELAAFFANPVGDGERMDAIGPMRGVTLTSRVVAPRTSIQEYELAGRKAFVPVIAFNALYEWSGGKAQSSLAYLVGRDTGQEKLGPLRADAGSREIRGLGARPLPVGVRT